MKRKNFLTLLVVLALFVSAISGSLIANAEETSQEVGVEFNAATAENMLGFSPQNGATFTFENVTDYNGVEGDTGVLVTFKPNTTGVVPVYFYSQIPMFISDDIDVTYKILDGTEVFNPQADKTSYADSVGVGFLPKLNKQFSDNQDAKGLIFVSQWSKSCRIPADGTMAEKGAPGNSEGFAVDCGAYGFVDELVGNDYTVTISADTEKDEFVLGFNKFFDEQSYIDYDAMNLYPTPYAEGDNQLQLRPSNLDKVYFTFYALTNTLEGEEPGTFKVLVKNLSTTLRYAEDLQIVGESTRELEKDTGLSLDFTQKEGSFDEFEWSSSDTNVCTVNSNGRVYAVGAGTATVTVTAVGGASASVTINVVENNEEENGGNNNNNDNNNDPAKDDKGGCSGTAHFGFMGLSVVFLSAIVMVLIRKKQHNK